MIEDFDIPDIRRMLDKIRAFEEGRLDLQGLVIRLISILNDQLWKDEFWGFLQDLEKVQATDLDENDKVTVDNAINSIKKLIDFKIHNKISEELKWELDQGYDAIRIARWAYSCNSTHIGCLDSTTKNVLQCLSIMELGPEFELPEAEVKIIAEKFINNEMDLLKQIIGMGSDD